MKTSEQISNVSAALAKAHAAMKPAVKDSTNPAFRSKYADLASHMDAIRSAYAPVGLSVIQELTSTADGVDVVTRILHTSGEWIECGPLCVPVSKHDAHGYGSACSYARRYALSAACGTVADDDDGAAAVQAPPVQTDAKPAGFDDWLADMSALSATVDVQTFRDAYKASRGSHRKYLETHDRPALDAMIAAAKGQTLEVVHG
jgi:hypothetical protein